MCVSYLVDLASLRTAHVDAFPPEIACGRAAVIEAADHLVGQPRALLRPGYDVILCDGLELINEARVDIPQGGEPWSVGMMTGFIATLFSAK